MTTIDVIVQVLVFGGFAFWAYSKVKRQSLMDTYEDIKDLFKGKSNG